MSYNSELQSNNTELQEILDAINALPEPEEITLQDKTVSPTTSKQEVTSDSGFTGLKKVTVNAIPSNYITTDDATAVAENILSGKTAYVKGSKVTGTMPNIGYDGNAPTIEYDSANKVFKPYISYKKGYHNGYNTYGTSKTPSSFDSNLVAENIKKDVSIFGVAGTYEGAGGTDWTTYNGTLYINRNSADVTYDGTTCAQITFNTDVPIILPSDATTDNTYFFVELNSLTINGLVKAIKIPSTGLAGADVSSLTFLIDDSSGYITYGMGLNLGGSKTYTVSHYGFYELSIYCNGRSLSIRNYKDRSQYDAANNFIT